MRCSTGLCTRGNLRRSPNSLGVTLTISLGTRITSLSCFVSAHYFILPWIRIEITFVFAVTNYTDEPSARTLRRASLIAEDAAAFGIPIAKMPDVLMAKKLVVMSTNHDYFHSESIYPAYLGTESATHLA